MIEVRIPTLLQQMYGAPPAIAVDAATPLAAIAALDQRWSGMGDRILEPNGALRPYLLLFVDGDYATLSTPLHAGAQMRIVPSIAGGEHGSDIAVDRSGHMDGYRVSFAKTMQA